MTVLPSHHPKYRTKLCRNFSNGNCPFGQRCSFLHPTASINPFLAQYLFNWNVLLPQLLALSQQQQQATLKTMQRQSPPRPPGLPFVDEESSLPDSLLLSSSDCTSPEQAPQARYSSRERRFPCWQFIRTGGWCSAGARCKFHHDMTALPRTDGQKAQHAPSLETDLSRDRGRTISGGVFMGVLSPPITGQENPELSRYTEAEPAQLYQPLYWPGYTWPPSQPYYAPVPATVTVPVPATMVPSSTAQHSPHLPLAQFPVQNVPPGGVQTCLPLGAYEVNGTIYFPAQMPSVPVPATCPIPVHSAPHGHTSAPAYPYYISPPPFVNCYDIPNQTVGTCPQTSFDPFSPDPLMSGELPITSRPEDYRVSPIRHGDPLPIPTPPPVLVKEGGSMNAVDKLDHEFPYQPPKNQQVGHARRISINIKKHSHTNSG